MNNIYLYNTLTKKKEQFVPIESGKVKIYSCGPTVYDYAHIGNFRSFLLSDLLVRIFRGNNFEVIKVQNITDVGHLTNDDLADGNGEDKVLRQAREKEISPWEIVKKFTQAFLQDEKILQILPPKFRPQASEFIPQQLKIIKELIAKNIAYEIDGSVYFRVHKFEKYGQLSGNSLSDLQAGARVEINSEKENPLDFALWKKAEKNHLMQWDYQTGEKISQENIIKFQNENPNQAGFPGWHIECSAMSLELLGDHFDLHTGGEDNVFPHHECEIAQNEAGKISQENSVNYWLHAKHLLVDDKKMSKSLGNFYTIKDLLDKGWTGEEIRYLLVSAHYRTALNFTLSGLEMARKSIQRLQEVQRILNNFIEKEVAGDENFTQSFQNDFWKALNNDCNTAEALAAVFSLIKKTMQDKENQELKPQQAQAVLDFLTKDFNEVFAILKIVKTEEFSRENLAEIEKLITERLQARTDKNWEKSDEIRDFCRIKFGIELLDEAKKTSWKKRD